MKRESIHSGQRVRYSDGKPSGVWTVEAIEEQVVLRAASGRRLAQADELEPADVAEEHPLPVEDVVEAPPVELTDRELMAVIALCGADSVPYRIAVELQRHRAMVKRLDEWAAEMERMGRGSVNRSVAEELRNRMRGAK